MFGAIELHTGRTSSHLAKNLVAAEQVRLLEQVAAANPGQRALLIWDSGATHRNQKVTA